MQTIANQLDTAFRRAIVQALGVEADPIIGISQNEAFGDYQSNAAMGLARQQKSNPRTVAEKIISHLDLGGMVSQPPTIAGPGFINIRLSPGWLADRLSERSADDRLGIDPAAQPQTVVVDYSGPNIAKQMHVGHLRSTIIGDCLSRVIEFQQNRVIRQNHLGDWGTQFGMLIAYLRSQPNDHDVHQNIADLEEFYRQAKKRFDEQPAFADEARNTVVRLQAGQSEELAAWRQIVDETRRHYQPIYNRLGVSLRPDHERGESFYNPMLQQVVQDLLDKGIATRSEGAVVVFTEGFENPLIIQKSDGGFLYGTTDLAAIRYRVHKLGAKRIIYTHDSRQAQHFAQVFAAARKAGWADGVSLEYAPFGTMLGADGKPFKTRSGDTVKLKDLLDEAEERAFGLVTQKNPSLEEPLRREIARAVGVGAVKYSDLSKDRTSDYIFNWDKMLSLDGNTAPYLQYAYARIKSIFRKADQTQPAAGVLQLDTPQEQALGKHLVRFGEVIETVGRELKPHHLCTYLYDLAVRFSSFYESCPVLQSEPAVRQSRLLLCNLTARTLEMGLDLLGIDHPEQM